jgi:hypothetical protein
LRPALGPFVYGYDIVKQLRDIDALVMREGTTLLENDLETLGAQPGCSTTRRRARFGADASQ